MSDFFDNVVSGFKSVFGNETNNTTNDEPVSSESNSPQNVGNDSLSVDYLSYPIDIGNYENRYMMRINIFRQLRSPATSGLVQGNAFDFERGVAQSALPARDFAGGAATLATAAGAQALLENIGKAGRGITRQNARRISDFANLGESAIPIAAAAGIAAENTEGFNTARKTYKTPRAYINLYMPETLNFVDRHDFDSVSVTDALGTAGRLSQGGFGEIIAREAERSGFFGSNFTDLYIYNSGYTINPQLEVLYRGSKNREFIFSFRFLPRSLKESKEVENIIRTLRYHAAPQFGADGVFVGASAGRYFVPPSEFDIEFYYINGDGATRYTRLPRIAQCVLSSVDVNYAPSGQFSAFKSSDGELGGPIEIQLQLTFTETVVLTKEDIGPGSAGSIGGF